MTTATSAKKKPALLINHNFAFLWSGQAISIIGDSIFDITLVLWIATQIARGLPWAPLAVSGVLLAASLPVFIVGPVAGVFVDRWDKRLTMLRMNVIQAVLVLLLLLMTGIVPLPLITISRLPMNWQLGTIYIIVFLISTCYQFVGPSYIALVGDIVDEPQRARATGLGQMVSSIATIVGPPLGTLLFFAVGVQWALFLDMLSFIVAFLAILAIRAPRGVVSSAPGQRGNLFREYVEGVRFVMRNRVLVTLLVTAFMAVLNEGVFSALGVFFVTQNLHTPLRFYGFLNTAVGVGLAAGAAFAAIFAQRIGPARLLWIEFTLQGVLFIIFARLTSFVPALVASFLFGLLAASGNVTFGPLMLHVTPRELIGRTSSTIGLVLNLSAMLSVAAAGYLDSTVLRSFHAMLLDINFGPVDTILTITGFLTLSGGLYAMVNLRGVKLSKGEDQPHGP